MGVRATREEGWKMREIKFRGKRVDNGEWVFGYPIVIGHRVFMADTNNHTKLRSICSPTADIRCVEVDPATVGQYTEHYDSNGKEELWEGDIVDFRRGERRLYIAFNAGQWNMCGDIQDPNADYRLLDHYVKHDGPIVKIGNIYENPELLSERKGGNG